jgi:hypothetical protein
MELKAQIIAFLEKSKEMSKTKAESGETGPMVNDRPLLVIERAHGRAISASSFNFHSISILCSIVHAASSSCEGDSFLQGHAL